MRRNYQSFIRTFLVDVLLSHRNAKSLIEPSRFGISANFRLNGSMLVTLGLQSEKPETARFQAFYIQNNSPIAVVAFKSCTSISQAMVALA